jgi:RNA polymerase sigma-70 factor (ECF subfamily)
MRSSCRARSPRAVVGVCSDAGGLSSDLEERRVRRLVLAAREGDRDAMQQLYRLHVTAVHAHVLRIVGDAHDADDVTQQVFAKLLTGLDRYRPGEAPFVAWVLRVAHNAAIDHVRRVQLVSCSAVEEAEALDDPRAEEARASLYAALASLPPAQRDVLLLMHVVGLSPREIADRLGRSVRSVHGLHYRGRVAARSALNDLGSAPTVAMLPSRRTAPSTPIHALSA